MNKKVFKRISMVVMMALILGVINVPETTFASDTEYKIDSKEELTDKLKDNHLKKRSNNTNEILQDTNPDLLKEYINEVEEEIINKVNKLPGLKVSSEKKEYVFDTKIIELSDGGYVEIKQESIPMMLSTFSFSPWGGNTYSYTYKVKHTLFPDTTFVLKTIYDVNRNNIECVSSSTAGSYAILPCTYKASSRVYKTTASSKGQYIGAQGDYNLTIAGYNGIGLVSKDYTLKSSITLNYIGTHGADVVLSCSVFK